MGPRWLPQPRAFQPQMQTKAGSSVSASISRKGFSYVFSFMKRKNFSQKSPSTGPDHRAAPEWEASWDSQSPPAMEVSGKGWGHLSHCSQGTPRAESWNHSEVMLDFKKASHVLPSHWLLTGCAGHSEGHQESGNCPEEWAC